MELVIKDPVIVYDDGYVEVYAHKPDIDAGNHNGPAQSHTKDSDEYSDVHGLQAILKFVKG
jgi:hypothetical protein